MDKFIKVPSFAEAVGILAVVAAGVLIWRLVVPAGIKKAIPGASASSN